MINITQRSTKKSRGTAATTNEEYLNSFWIDHHIGRRWAQRIQITKSISQFFATTLIGIVIGILTPQNDSINVVPQ